LEQAAAAELRNGLLHFEKRDAGIDAAWQQQQQQQQQREDRY